MIGRLRFTAQASRIVRVLVGLMSVLALFLYFRLLSEHWMVIRSFEMGVSVWIVVLFASIFYAMNLFFLAELWHRLLQNTQVIKLGRKTTFASFAKTQIAKYLPGNVFQYVGRHIDVAKHGAHNQGLALAVFLEINVLVLAALSIILLGITLGLAPQAGLIFEMLDGSWLAFAVIISLTAFGIMFIFRAVRIRSQLPLPKIREFFNAYFIAVLFFLVMGLIFSSIIKFVSYEGNAGLMFVAVISWLVGYVSPGAPGGIGVREFVMLALLPSSIPEAQAVLAIGLFRLSTTLGDLLFFVIGLAISRESVFLRSR